MPRLPETRPDPRALASDLEAHLETLTRALNADGADAGLFGSYVLWAESPDEAVRPSLEWRGARWRPAPCFEGARAWVLTDAWGEALARLTAPSFRGDSWRYALLGRSDVGEPSWERVAVGLHGIAAFR